MTIICTYKAYKKTAFWGGFGQTQVGGTMAKYKQPSPPFVLLLQILDVLVKLAILQGVYNALLE